MQFGKTLVGAIIGGALGIGLLIAVYLAFGIDKMWMAIPVAILTGLGVRSLAAKNGNASYLRGAITVALAMAAYMGGLSITKAVATNRTDKIPKLPPPADAKMAPADDQEKSEEPAADTPPAPTAPLPVSTPNVVGRGTAIPNQFSPLDFLALGIAALVAYKLGRGSDGGEAVIEHVPGEPSSMGTHPDA